MARAPTTHPSPQQLADYGLGQLPPGDLAAIHTHLVNCPECRDRVEQPGASTPVSKTVPARGGTLLPTAAPAAATTSRPAPAPVAAATAGAIPPELAGSGKYEVLGKLGHGGMGSVYKARHVLLGELVAIKVLNTDVVENAEARSRFLGEMRAVARLNHPNIVRALDAEQIGERLVLVMEYVPGITLDRLVTQKGALPVTFACRCIMQAALGLQHAHEKGLIHRDIKPANLMVTSREKEVKLLDFGLARGPREPLAGGNRTQMQMFMGTPEYVAPEQATDARTADIRADIYSLGCTLYFLLAGRPPFQEDTPMNTVVAQIQDEAPPLMALRDDLPAGLAEVVAKMVAKKPADRFQTPLEAARALQPFAARSGKTVAKAPPPVEAPLRTPPPSRPARSGLARWGLGVGGLVGCLLLAALVAWLVRPAAPAKGKFLVEIDPPGALVLVDDEEVAQAGPDERQVEIEVSAGGHDLEVRKDGFEPQSRRLTCRKGEPEVVTVRLQRRGEKQFRLAQEHHLGVTRKLDLVEAARLYREAANQGHLLAEGFLGLLHARGEGVDLDTARARKHCLAATAFTKEEATKGSAVAQQLLGHMHREGLGVAKDDKEAMRWFRLAADKGNSAAQANLGWMYKHGEGVKTDFQEALRWYRLAADRGYPRAMNNLASMYRNGEGVEKDYREALRWYRLAIDRGDITAQVNLAGMYHKGQGVEKDSREAVRLLRLAADKGLTAAQNNLAWMYQHGEGVAKDYKEALRCYRLAADKGDTTAWTNLGGMYLNGQGVEKDYKEALRCYRLAAERGNAAAQRSLGRMYEQGIGVPRDPDEARKWYQKVAQDRQRAP
jgi:TPR repeat protein